MTRLGMDTFAAHIKGLALNAKFLKLWIHQFMKSNFKHTNKKEINLSLKKRTNACLNNNILINLNNYVLA